MELDIDNNDIDPDNEGAPINMNTVTTPKQLQPVGAGKNFYKTYIDFK